MKIPFRFRRIPRYAFDGDGMFSKPKFHPRDKRWFSKKQRRKFFKDFERE